MGLVTDTVTETLELWEQIPAWPRYWVSAKGRVYSESSGKHLKPYTNESGEYHVVTLYRLDGSPREKQFYIHWLVAECFLSPDENEDLVVHHLNGDPLDNRVSNLQLLDAEEHREMHRKEQIENDPLAMTPEERGVFDTEDEAPF